MNTYPQSVSNGSHLSSFPTLHCIYTCFSLQLPLARPSRCLGMVLQRHGCCFGVTMLARPLLLTPDLTSAPYPRSLAPG